MKFKKLTALVTALLALTLFQFSVSAADLSLCQTYVSENYLDVFVNGSFDTLTPEVKIANQPVEMSIGGLVTDIGITVRTTVLLDISTSMPSDVRDEVLTYINSLIEDLPENEELKLATFAEELNVLQDFTDDRYDLSTATEKIEFNGQQSKIYDAIYNTIPELAPIDGEPCYYRTIVITDGIDDTASGVTKEELYIRLADDTYPIEVVAVSKTKQSEPEKELSALTRMSGGSYSNIYPDADINSIQDVLRTNDIFWIRASLPIALLDGSIRQVNISDGVNEISFDVKVSTVDMPETTTQTTAETTTITSLETTTAITTTTSVTTAVAETVSEPEKTPLFGENTALILNVAGIVVIILIIVIIAVTRKKKPQPPTVEVLSDPRRNLDKTEFFDEETDNGNEYTIKLSNTRNRGQNWILPVKGEIIIGRSEHADIKLEDKSVAREQCKIVISGQKLAVAELSSSNKTKLNGIEISGKMPLSPGDILKFGRESLTVEYIHSVGQNTPRKERDTSRDETESIFER
jgi:hypothetical protein